MDREGKEFVLSCWQAQELAGKEIMRLRRVLDADRERIDALAANLFRESADRDRLLAAAELTGRSGAPPRDFLVELREAPEWLGRLREASTDPDKLARLATALEARSALYSLLASQEVLLEQAITAEQVPFSERDHAMVQLDLAIDRSTRALGAWLRDSGPADRNADVDLPQPARISPLPDGDLPWRRPESDPWWGPSEPEALAEPEPDIEPAEPERRR